MNIWAELLLFLYLGGTTAAGIILFGAWLRVENYKQTSLWFKLVVIGFALPLVILSRSTAMTFMFGWFLMLCLNETHPLFYLYRHRK